MPSPEQNDGNINPIPADKLEKKIISAIPTYSRRQFIVNSGKQAVGIGAGLIFLGIGIGGIIREINEGIEEQKRAEEIPNLPSEQVKAAGDESEADKNRKELEDKVWTIGDKVLLGTSVWNSLIGLFWIKKGYSAGKKAWKDQSEAKERFVDLVLGVRTDWKESPPTEEELNSFCQGLSYLPPVGGKIPLTWQWNGMISISRNKLLDPSLMAEQQVSKVVEMRQENKLGEIYVHQLTVQGRLPDEFKYVALALILNSQYKYDWTKPFFETPWGRIAPLIHDGGNVKVGYNPVWKNVKGRTDFLQRIAEVHEPQLEEMERLDIKDVGRLSVDKLARARLEQEERNRLLNEARAYQRLGLALHCRAGTAPKIIPFEMQDKLSELWEDEFENKMDGLLREYGIIDAVQIRWFNSSPVQKRGFYDKRYEAEWPPIQRELIALEEVREKNPEIRGKVTKLLIDIADQVDREIGILPKTNNSQS